MVTRGALWWSCHVLLVALLVFSVVAKIAAGPEGKELALVIIEAIVFLLLVVPQTSHGMTWLLACGLVGAPLVYLFAASRIDFDRPCGCAGDVGLTSGQALIALGVLMLLAVGSLVTRAGSFGGPEVPAHL
jgi:hypothetical protein